MFSYYGSKSKIAKLYPEPKYRLIIEPFAGAANYSLLHAPGRDVVLCEKSEDVFLCWKWLQKATEDDILSLPIPASKEPIPQLEPRGKSVFLAFTMNQGTAKPRKSAGGMQGCSFKSVTKRLQKAADRLSIVRDWDIRLGSYEMLPDVEATWYIDPPYIREKWNEYKFGPKTIDYESLARWCKSRKGQVIVAENDSATWLPFRPLVTCAGQRSTSTLRNEGIWTND